MGNFLELNLILNMYFCIWGQSVFLLFGENKMKPLYFGK